MDDRSRAMASAAPNSPSPEAGPKSEENSSPTFIDCCLTGDIDRVGHEIELGAALHETDQQGNTPLFYCCASGNQQLVQFMLGKGADPFIVSSSNLLPIHCAVRLGHADVIGMFVKRYPDIDEKCRSLGVMSLLDYAIHSDVPIIGEALLEAGLSLGKLDNSFILLEASRGNRTGCARAFIKRGCEVNLADPDTGYTSLHYASLHNNVELVRELLAIEDIRINAASFDEGCPLHLSLRQPGSAVTSLLLKAGANVNEPDSTQFGVTPLFLCSLIGCEEDCKLLLSYGADPNKGRSMDGMGPLHRAVESGNENIVKTLVENDFIKADVNMATTTSNVTPLWLSANAGHATILKYLASKGADVDMMERNSVSPLHQASINGHIDSVEALLDAGADINAVEVSGITAINFACTGRHVDIVELLIKRGAALEPLREDSVGPLSIACATGCLSIVKMLLDAIDNPKISINLPGPDGRTPIMFALSKNCVSPDLVLLLLEHGANLDISSNKGDSVLDIAATRKDPLIVQTILASMHSDSLPIRLGSAKHNASLMDNLEVLKILLQESSDLEEINNDGLNLLFSATLGEALTCMNFFIQKGAEVNLRATEMKYTPLHWAIFTDSFEAVQLLVEGGADLTLADKSNNSPLLLATKENKYDMVKYFLENEADISAQDSEGDTALHVACWKGLMNIAHLLVHYRASWRIRNTAGHTPFTLVAQHSSDPAVANTHIVADSLPYYLSSELYLKAVSQLSSNRQFRRKMTMVSNVTNTQQRLNDKYYEPYRDCTQVELPHLQDLKQICLKSVNAEFHYGCIDLYSDVFLLSELTKAKPNATVSKIVTDSVREISSCLSAKLNVTFEAVLCGSNNLGIKVGELDEFDFRLDFRFADSVMRLVTERERDQISVGRGFASLLDDYTPLVEDGIYEFLKNSITLSKENNDFDDGGVHIYSVAEAIGVPCVNLKIGWKCPNLHVHRISIDLTPSLIIDEPLVPRLSAVYFDTITQKTPYKHIHSGNVQKQVYVRKCSKSDPFVWKLSFSSVNQSMYESLFLEGHSTCARSMIVLKVIRDLTFPRVYKYLPFCINSGSTEKEGELVSSYVLQQLTYMEYYEHPDISEWNGENYWKRILSVLQKLTEERFTEIYSDKQKHVLNIPRKDRDRMRRCMRRDVSILTDVFEDLASCYTRPSIEEIDRLHRTIEHAGDRVCVVLGDGNLISITRDKFTNPEAVRAELEVPTQDNLYFYHPPSVPKQLLTSALLYNVLSKTINRFTM